MADDPQTPENEDLEFDARSRESLKKAADSLLKADRAARKRAAAESADDFADYDDGETPDFGEGDAYAADADIAGVIGAEMEKMQAEIQELKDQNQRLLAEMENLRRRTQREVGDAKQYAVANFARDMLGVGDNLGRAIDAVPEEKRESGSDDFKALLEGVELTAKSMLSTMER
ncbi:MAG: nucleotide exchange factor GrpE, partial [Pseudomonadota bacterium]